MKTFTLLLPLQFGVISCSSTHFIDAITLKCFAYAYFFAVLLCFRY